MIQATVRVIANDATSVGWLATSGSQCVGGSTDANSQPLAKQIAQDAAAKLGIPAQSILVVGA